MQLREHSQPVGKKNRREEEKFSLGEERGGREGAIESEKKQKKNWETGS